MVEVGAKPETARGARAQGCIELRTDTLSRLMRGDLPRARPNRCAHRRDCRQQAHRRSDPAVPPAAHHRRRCVVPAVLGTRSQERRSQRRRPLQPSSSRSKSRPRSHRRRDGSPHRRLGRRPHDHDMAKAVERGMTIGAISLSKRPAAARPLRPSVGQAAAPLDKDSRCAALVSSAKWRCPADHGARPPRMRLRERPLHRHFFGIVWAVLCCLVGAGLLAMGRGYLDIPGGTRPRQAKPSPPACADLTFLQGASSESRRHDRRSRRLLGV